MVHCWDRHWGKWMGWLKALHWALLMALQMEWHWGWRKVQPRGQQMGPDLVTHWEMSSDLHLAEHSVQNWAWH